MGVDIQTYRARIGTYSYSKGGDVVTVANQVNIRDGIKSIGCLIFIGILLVMAGIELNPGPKEKDSHADIPCIRIDGLLENVNKEMLEMFFENEERQGRGKVKSIEIDSKNKCATILFDEKAAVDAFMQRNPKTILGIDVTVKVLESRCIKITGPLANMNKQMLGMFFDKEERDGGGKVKSIDLDSKIKCAIVEFEDKTGVDRIMKKTPMTIFGLPVHIEVTDGKVFSDTEHSESGLQKAESVQTTETITVAHEENGSTEYDENEPDSAK